MDTLFLFPVKGISSIQKTQLDIHLFIDIKDVTRNKEGERENKKGSQSYGSMTLKGVLYLPQITSN